MLQTTGNEYIDYFILLFVYVVPLMFITFVVMLIIEKISGHSEGKIEYTAPRWAYYVVKIMDFMEYAFIALVLFTVIDYVVGDMTFTSFIDTMFFGLLGTIIYYLMLRSIIVILLGTDGHSIGVPRGG